MVEAAVPPPVAMHSAAQPHAKAEPSAAAALRDQLAIVSFVVLFAGLVFTDTYYNAFGIRYQLLDFPLQHLIYRGLTALIENWLLGIAYVLILAWVAFLASWLAEARPRWRQFIQLTSYLIVMLAAATAYWAGGSAGARAAFEDMSEKTSRLPIIVEAKHSDGTIVPIAGDRLLIVGKDAVVVFKASDDSIPFVHILKREDVGEITLRH